MAKSLKLSWYADMKAESDLRRMAVVFNIISIPFSKIDLKESQVNGARLNDAIRHHKVEDYMQGFKNGDTFPRAIVHKTPTGYVILGGNQRCEAIRRLIESGDVPKSVEIEVYLIETTDKLLLEIIARSANATHGEGDTKEERLQHSVYCVQRLGMAVCDAAKSFNVSAAGIRNNINAESMRSQLQRAGIEAQRIGVNSLAPLKRLNFDEPAQEKVGALIAQHAPTVDRVKQVVAVIEKQTTAHDRIAAIKSFERELAAEAHAKNGHAKNGSGRNGDTASRVPNRPRRDKLIGILTRLVIFLESENAGEPFSTLEQLQVTTQVDRERVTDLIKRAKYRLGAIAK